MKCNMLTGLALIALTAMSCSKTKTYDELLIGTWTANSLTMNGSEIINTAPEYTNMQWTYATNGQATISQSAGTATFNYTLNGSVITTTPVDTTTMGNIVVNYTINSLDETTLNFSFSNSGNNFVGNLVK